MAVRKAHTRKIKYSNGSTKVVKVRKSITKIASKKPKY